VNLFQWEEAAIAELKKELAEKSQSSKESRKKQLPKMIKPATIKQLTKLPTSLEKKTEKRKKDCGNCAMN
jgi:hypothetical protein